MLTTDWLISTSHDTFALQYHGEWCYGIYLYRLLPAHLLLFCLLFIHN